MALGDKLINVFMNKISFTKQHTSLLKFFFVLTVTLFHILRDTYMLPIMPSYGVVGFFIISGYGCYISLYNNGFKIFIKNRISYIVIPYYIALFFYIIAHYYFDFYSRNTTLIRDIIGIITHVFFIHNISGYTQWTIAGVLWFIAPIMQLYLLSYYFKKLVDLNKIIPIATIVFLFITSYIVKEFFHIKNLYFFNGWHIIYIAPFLTGMLMAKYHVFLLNRISEIFNKTYICIFYVLFVILITYKTIYSKNITVITFVLLISFPALLFICNILSAFVTSRIIAFLGVFSFFIYLYNYTFYVFTPLYCMTNPLVNAITDLLIIVVVAYTFYLLNKWIKKRYYK